MSFIVKAISVKQPWANTIVLGEKTIETRTWRTSYRGLLLIVSSKKPSIAPTGCALAFAKLTECRPMTLDDELDACCLIYDRAVAWMLSEVYAILPEFRFSVSGKLGLYNVELVDNRALSTAKLVTPYTSRRTSECNST